jgi:hypothetical protein
MTAQLTTGTRNTGIHGIDIFGPGTPDFDRALNTIVPGIERTAALNELLARSVIVHNSGNQDIRGITVRFDAVNAQGRRVARTETFEALDSKAEAPFKRSSFLLISMHRLFTHLALSRRLDEAASVLLNDKDNADTFRSFKDIVASVDSVILNDGTFAGPDVAGTFADLSARTSLERELISELRTVIESKNAGHVRTYLVTKATQPKESMIGKIHSANVQQNHAAQLLAAFEAGGIDPVRTQLEQLNLRLARAVEVKK